MLLVLKKTSKIPAVKLPVAAAGDAGESPVYPVRGEGVEFSRVKASPLNFPVCSSTKVGGCRHLTSPEVLRSGQTGARYGGI